MVRLGLFILFISKTIMLRVFIHRDEFCSEDIQSKAFSFIKKVSLDNIPDIGARERVEYSMNNKYIL